MRQSARGFLARPRRPTRRSARLSMGRARFVGVVRASCGARLAAARRRASTSAYALDKLSASRRRPPCTPPARRARRFRREGCAGRARSATALAAARIASRSSSVKPPSGPIRISAGPGRERVGGRFAARFVGEVKVRVRRRSSSSKLLERHRLGDLRQPRAPALLGRLDRDRSRSRSSFTRSATVRCVITGISRAAPSSVAFSTSQSVCARFTGAKASQTSGMVSGSRVRRSTVERHPLLAGLGDPRQPFAGAAVEQQQLAARAHPQHIAEIVRLTGVELDAAPSLSGCRTNRRGRLFGGQAGVAGMARHVPTRDRCGKQ